VDCYIWYSEEETPRGPSPPRSLLAVPINIPPINGQSTSFVLFDVALLLHLESKGLTSDVSRLKDAFIKKVPYVYTFMYVHM